MAFIEISFALILGLILGSFTSALVYRIPRKYSWIRNGDGGTELRLGHRSQCLSCGHILKPVDLVPVFSWLFAKGRCRYCKSDVSSFYPLIELALALAALGVYLRFGMSVQAALIVPVLPFLAALFVIDLRYMILPNSLVLIMGLLGLVRIILGGFVFYTIDPSLVGMNFILGGFVYMMLALFLGRLMAVFLKKDALGQGDVKFFAVAGLWLGLSKLSLFCLLAGVFGIVLAVLWRIFKKEQVFPFGPALIAAFYGLLLI